MAQDRVFGAIDATSKHGEGQSCVEAEVEERMPAFPAYPDGTLMQDVGDDGGKEAQEHDRCAGIHNGVQELPWVLGQGEDSL